MNQELNQFKNRVSEAFDKEKITDVVKSVYQEAIDKLEKAGFEVKKHSLETRDAVGVYVKDNPFKSVGVAMAVGALIALLLRR